jgi:hypothetical protein
MLFVESVVRGEAGVCAGATIVDLSTVVDVALYVDLIGKLGVSSLNAAGPLASFGVERTSVMATR